jgi:hypothetical protein
MFGSVRQRTLSTMFLWNGKDQPDPQIATWVCQYSDLQAARAICSGPLYEADLRHWREKKLFKNCAALICPRANNMPAGGPPHRS